MDSPGKFRWNLPWQQHQRSIAADQERTSGKTLDPTKIQVHNFSLKYLHFFKWSISWFETRLGSILMSIIGRLGNQKKKQTKNISGRSRYRPSKKNIFLEIYLKSKISAGKFPYSQVLLEPLYFCIFMFVSLILCYKTSNFQIMILILLLFYLFLLFFITFAKTFYFDILIFSWSYELH